MAWEPAGAVVFVGQRPGGGPAATACCDALNFFTSTATARAWRDAHPEVPGRTVDQDHAEEIAAETFGPLLTPLTLTFRDPARTAPRRRPSPPCPSRMGYGPPSAGVEASARAQS
nr:alkylmercury lyase family protein [Streptomyces sp. NBC_00830]